MTYVGELGWELYPSAEYGLALWDTLLGAGRPHGLVPAGYRAIDSLRLEKGYRVWGTDITSETDPHSAGLGFAVRSGEDFIGRGGAASDRGGPDRLVCLVLDDLRSVALGNEPVRTASGEVVGRVTSGGQGYAVTESIAYAWVPAERATIGTELTVEVFGETCLPPPWRPNRASIRLARRSGADLAGYSVPCSRASSSRSIACSSSGEPWTLGPVNHFLAQNCHDNQNANAARRISGPVKLKLFCL